MARPYLKLRIEELERMFAAARRERAVLEPLAGELSKRTSERASALLRKVEQALAAPAVLSGNPAARRRTPDAARIVASAA